MGECKEFVRVWMVGELGNFWWVKELDQIWGKYGKNGKMWGKNGKVCWGVGEMSGMWGSMG